MKKQVLSVLLTICMLLTLLPTAALAVDPPTTTAATYAAAAVAGTDYVLDTGNSTLAIKTARGAAYWSTLPAELYRTYTVTLEADVDVSEFLWSPVTPDSENAFIGTFDGNGHTISGLTISSLTTTGNFALAGVFGFLYYPGIVKNLTVSGTIDVSGEGVVVNSYVGGIVAYYSSGTIDHCTNKTNISLTAVSTTGFAGGIAGYTGGSVRNCANTGSVSVTSSYEAYAGGIVGRNIGVVSNCYNTGVITAQGTINPDLKGIPGVYGGCAGGICGLGGIITNCYNSRTINGSDNSGGICGAEGTITNCYWLGTTSTVSKESFTATGCGTFTSDSSGITAGTTANCGGSAAQDLAYGTNLLTALNGWVSSTDYYTWAADSTTSPANGGYPVFDAPFTTTTALTGTVTITGSAKFGATLTAALSDSNNSGAPIYQWKRGETNIGTDSSTYTLEAADIGTTITCEVRSSVRTGTLTSAATGTIAKADAPAAPGAPTLSKTTTTITVSSPVDGQEYAIVAGTADAPTAAGEWNTTGSFAGLNANTAYRVYTRVKETTTTKAGATSYTDVTTDKLTQTITVSNSTPSVTVGNTLNLAALCSSNAAGATLTYEVGTPLDGTSLNTTTGVVTAGSNTGSFVVKVNSAAFGDYTAAAEQTITVAVTAKTAVTISGISMASKTYDGTAVASTGSFYAAVGDTPVAFLDSQISYQWKTAEDGALSEAPQNAGSYKLVISAENSEYIGTTTLNFTIDKATITIAAANKSAYVGGSAPNLTSPVAGTDYTVTGLVGDDALTTAPVLTCSPTMNTAGTYSITASGAVSSANYNIVYVPGTLTVSYLPSSNTGGSYTPPTVDVPVTGAADTIEVSATVSRSTATVKEIKPADIEQAAGSEGTGQSIVVDLTGLNKDIDQAKFTGSTLKNLAEAANDPNSGMTGVTIKLSGAEVTFDAALLTTLVEQTEGGALLLNVDEEQSSALNAAQKKTVADITNPKILDAYFTSGDQRISDFKGGTALITVPYDRQGSGAVLAVYVDENGSRTEIRAQYDPVKKLASFIAPHFSYYVITETDVCLRDETCPADKFSDLNLDLWYHDGVHYCVEHKLMSGYSGNLFGPEDTTSRAMIVTILYRLEGSPVVNYSMDFADVTESKYYAEAVRWAASIGVVGGYGNGLFGPDDAVSREQLAAILWRYAKYKGMDVGVGEATNILSYKDAIEVSEWAIPAMQWACGAGIVQGSDGSLMPDGTAKRCEAAAMLQRYCELALKE